MNEILSELLVFVAGLLLGSFFFGGLWFTVKKIATSKRPALWVLSSFICRVAITLFCFYLIGAGCWQYLIICILGFIAARFIIIHFTKPIEKKKALFKKEATHET